MNRAKVGSTGGKGAPRRFNGEYIGRFKGLSGYKGGQVGTVFKHPLYNAPPGGWPHGGGPLNKFGSFVHKKVTGPAANFTAAHPYLVAALATGGAFAYAGAAGAAGGAAGTTASGAGGGSLAGGAAGAGGIGAVGFESVPGGLSLGGGSLAGGGAALGGAGAGGGAAGGGGFFGGVSGWKAAQTGLMGLSLLGGAKSGASGAQQANNDLQGLITSQNQAAANALAESTRYHDAALAMQADANAQAIAQAQASARNAEIAINRANQKRPNGRALLDQARQAGRRGQSGTMLTGSRGVDPSTLTLGSVTLLGA